MQSNNGNPATLAARGAPKTDLAGASINSDNTKSLQLFQARRLTRRCAISFAALEILSGDLRQAPDGQCWFTLARIVEGEPFYAFTNKVGAETGLAVPEDFADVLFDLAIEKLGDAR